MTAPSRISKKLASILLAVAVLGVAVVLLLRSGIDRDQLQKQVDAFATSLHERAEQHGRDVTLTYGAIDIEGGLTQRHGVIRDVKLTIQPMDSSGTDKNVPLVVGTAVVEIYPDSADFSAVEIRLPQPIDFTNEGDSAKKLLTVKADIPLTLALAQMEKDATKYLDLTHNVPTKTELTYLREQQTRGEEDETPELVPVYKTLTVTAAPGGEIRSHTSMDDQNLGVIAVNIKGLRLLPEGVPNGEIDIAEILLDSSKLVNEKGQTVGALKVRVGEITAAAEFLPYAPISLTVDGSYESAKTPQDLAAIASSAASVKLSDFTLTTKEAKLMAKGDFTSKSSDILPEGAANITLTNVPYVLKELRENGVVNDTNEGFVVPVLEMTTGQKIADITDAVIEIKRSQGGAFAIGKTTFEELFAAMLKNALAQAQPKPITAPPAATSPEKKAPGKDGARMLEDSARG